MYIDIRYTKWCQNKDLFPFPNINWSTLTPLLLLASMLLSTTMLVVRASIPLPNDVAKNAVVDFTAPFQQNNNYNNNVIAGHHLLMKPLPIPPAVKPAAVVSIGAAAAADSIGTNSKREEMMASGKSHQQQKQQQKKNVRFAKSMRMPYVTRKGGDAGGVKVDYAEGLHDQIEDDLALLAHFGPIEVSRRVEEEGKKQKMMFGWFQWKKKERRVVDFVVDKDDGAVVVEQLHGLEAAIRTLSVSNNNWREWNCDVISGVRSNETMKRRCHKWASLHKALWRWLLYLQAREVARVGEEEARKRELEQFKEREGEKQRRVQMEMLGGDVDGDEDEAEHGDDEDEEAGNSNNKNNHSDLEAIRKRVSEEVDGEYNRKPAEEEAERKKKINWNEEDFYGHFAVRPELDLIRSSRQFGIDGMMNIVLKSLANWKKKKGRATIVAAPPFPNQGICELMERWARLLTHGRELKDEGIFLFALKALKEAVQNEYATLLSKKQEFSEEFVQKFGLEALNWLVKRIADEKEKKKKVEKI